MGYKVIEIPNDVNKLTFNSLYGIQLPREKGRGRMDMTFNSLYGIRNWWSWLSIIWTIPFNSLYGIHRNMAREEAVLVRLSIPFMGYILCFLYS